MKTKKRKKDSERRFWWVCLFGALMVFWLFMMCFKSYAAAKTEIEKTNNVYVLRFNGVGTSLVFSSFYNPPLKSIHCSYFMLNNQREILEYPPLSYPKFPPSQKHRQKMGLRAEKVKLPSTTVTCLFDQNRIFAQKKTKLPKKPILSKKQLRI